MWQRAFVWKCGEMWWNDLLRVLLLSRGVTFYCFILIKKNNSSSSSSELFLCFQICHRPNWHHKMDLATAGWSPVEVAVKNIRRLFCKNETSAEKEATHKLACSLFPVIAILSARRYMLCELTECAFDLLLDGPAGCNDVFLRAQNSASLGAQTAAVISLWKQIKRRAVLKSPYSMSHHIIWSVIMKSDDLFISFCPWK